MRLLMGSIALLVDLLGVHSPRAHSRLPAHVGIPLLAPFCAPHIFNQVSVFGIIPHQHHRVVCFLPQARIIVEGPGLIVYKVGVGDDSDCQGSCFQLLHNFFAIIFFDDVGLSGKK